MANIYLVRFSLEKQEGMGEILGAFSGEEYAKAFIDEIIQLSHQYQRTIDKFIDNPEFSETEYNNKIIPILKTIAQQINNLLSNSSKLSSTSERYIFGPEGGQENPFNWFISSGIQPLIDEIELQIPLVHEISLFERTLGNKNLFKINRNK